MPWGGTEVYEAAKACAACSATTRSSRPGGRWRGFEHAEAPQATVGVEDHSAGTFASKPVGQLNGVQPDAIQLCAELLLVQLLGENDTGGARKAEHVEAVLELLPRPLEFRAALDVGGTASYGMGKNGRGAYMRFVIRLFVSVKQRDANAPGQAHRLGADSTQRRGAGGMASASSSAYAWRSPRSPDRTSNPASDPTARTPSGPPGLPIGTHR